MQKPHPNPQIQLQVDLVDMSESFLDLADTPQDREAIRAEILHAKHVLQKVYGTTLAEARKVIADLNPEVAR